MTDDKKFLITMACFFALIYGLANCTGKDKRSRWTDPADDCAYSSSKWGC